MDYLDYIEEGLEGEAPLKVIMEGKIHHEKGNKIGVVSLIFATMDKKAAEEKIKFLISESTDNYYMVYSVPLDVDLNKLDHYPSIAIKKEDVL